MIEFSRRIDDVLNRNTLLVRPVIQLRSIGFGRRIGDQFFGGDADRFGLYSPHHRDLFMRLEHANRFRRDLNHEIGARRSMHSVSRSHIA